MSRAVLVTRYRAADGTLFESEKAADQRDADLRAAERITAILGARPDIEHGQHIAHTPEKAQEFHRALIAWSRVRMPSSWWERVSATGDEVHRASFAARMASDTGGIVNDLWWRRQCIDNAGREWDQPYFANQADTGGGK